MNNNSGNVLLALLTGAAIGGIAGILYAPDKGEETRKRLKDSALKTRDDLNVRLHKAADELTKTADAKKADFDRRLDETISDHAHNQHF